MAEEYVLTITNVSPGIWRATVTGTPQVIGRGSGAEIRIPRGFGSVSREHARMWVDQRGAWIRDLGSTRGTKVNGVTLAAQCNTKLTDGDRIALGTLELNILVPDHMDDNVLFDDGPKSTDSTDDTFKLKSNESVDLLAGSPLDDLTNAEREVVLWVSRGCTTPDEIGKRLFRSPHTVRTQLNSIFRKLNVHSRDELLAYVVRLGAPDANGAK
jgi:DNA-binding CsgD family transcriptional regulator